MDKTEQFRQLLQFALEAIWVQQQTINDLIMSQAAFENVLKDKSPQLFDEYQNKQDRLRSLGHDEAMSIVHRIERELERVKALKN